jgi:hypothetical protein
MGLARLGAALAAVASVSFALGAPGHVDGSWPYPAFFVTVAAAEMAVAVVLVLAARPADRRSVPDRRMLRAASLMGAIVAFAALTVFLATVGDTAHVGQSGDGTQGADLVSRVAELALLAVLVWLLASTRSAEAEAGPRP